MKYFKPDLLARCGSLDDDSAERAAEEWEQAITKYRERIRTIRPRLPLSVRRLLSGVSLHDAKVLAITVGEDEPTLTVLVQLTGTPSQMGDVLELGYLSAAGPQGGVLVRKHLQISHPSDPSLVWILYDEFDLDEKRAFFTHSLLLTNSNEIKVRFHRLRVRRLQEVFVSPIDLPAVQRTWPLIEA